MRLGLHLGSGPQADLPGLREVARCCEAAEFDTLWVGEAYGPDSVSLLAWLAAGTSSIGIGAGIMQMPARSAAMTAMSAVGLDSISGGRLVLGLGASGPLISEGLHGVPFRPQLRRTREYVDLVRRALAGGPIAGEGPEIPVPLDPNLPPLRLAARVERPVPILLAALGPHNTALAGEVADGWMPFLVDPAHLDELSAPVVEGRRRAAVEDPARPFRIVVTAEAFLDKDIESARDRVRPTLARYIGGMGARGANFYAKVIAGYGFDAVAERVQDLYLAGDRAAAAAALPGELIDRVTLAGSAAQVRERLREHAAVGVDSIALAIPTNDRHEMIDQVRAFGELQEDA